MQPFKRIFRQFANAWDLILENRDVNNVYSLAIFLRPQID